MQVYFIDNEDFFKRRAVLRDDKGNLFDDNDDRMVFFTKGVIETVKKLNWSPDIIHLHGWFTSLFPLYLKTLYKDEPLFQDSKLVTSVYPKDFEGPMSEELKAKIAHDKIEDESIDHLAKASYENLMQVNATHADGFVIASEAVDQQTLATLKSTKKPLLEYADTHQEDAYVNFYTEKICWSSMPLSKALRPSGALIVVALAIASCNKDFHGVGANLLEEQAFNTQSVRVPVYAYQDATEKVQADGLPLAQLGEIHHPVFGKAQAAIVSQLQLTSNAVFGNFSQAREDALDEDNIQVIQENEQVIAAYLEIPFFNNLKDSDSDGVIDAFDSDPEDPQSDTDGDGLSDLIETQSGYNPLDPDSDGDGILDPYDEDSEFDQ